MVRIISRNLFNRVLYSTLLLSTPITSFQYANAQDYVFGFEDAFTIAKITKLAHSLVDNKHNTNKMIETIVDIKIEIERACNVRIDLNYYMNQVCAQVKAQVPEVPMDKMNIIRQRINDRIRRVNCNLEYIDDVKYLEGYEINDDDFDMFYLGQRPPNRPPNNNNMNSDDDGKGQDEIPASLIYGVTVSLCGMFLMILPFPPCKELGKKVIVVGLSATANSICKEIDDRKKDKDKDDK